MDAKGYGLALLLLLWSASAQAQLVLLWDYPRDIQPPPEFLVTAVSAAETTGQPTQLQVAASTPGACLGFPTATQDTWCAALPCPGPGAYALTIQAVRAGMVSAPSNVVTGGIRDGAACTWVGIDQLAAAPPAPPGTTAQPVPSGTAPPVHPTTDTPVIAPTTPSAAAPDCTRSSRSQQRRQRAPGCHRGGQQRPLHREGA